MSTPKRPKHFRVIEGPVDKPTECLSIADFREKVPRASVELIEAATSFFVNNDPSAVLEVVPV